MPYSTIPAPNECASFTGKKLKRKMSQGTSKQSHFLRTEITNTPNSRVYRHSCVAETFAQLHKVSLYREKPSFSRREEACWEEGTEKEEQAEMGAAQVAGVLLWWLGCCSGGRELVSPAGSPGFDPQCKPSVMVDTL